MAADKQRSDGPKGMTILYQILAAMLITALIPIGGLWYISILKAKEEWTANIYHTLAANTEGLRRQVDEWAVMNLRILEQNSLAPDMQGMDAAKQNPVLKTISETYPWIYLAFTIRPDGENAGRSDGGSSKFYGDREYFKQVMDGRGTGQQVLMGKTSGKPAFILAKPIMKEGGGKVGVIAIAMTLEDLSTTVTNLKIGKSGFAILVDDKNRLIAHGQGAIANELQDLGAHPALGGKRGSGPENFVFEDGDNKIVAYTTTTALGWKLIVQQDASEAYEAADRARTNAFLLLGITLAVVLVVAYLLATRLSIPMKNLTLIADEISKGRLGARIRESGRQDEIGALARAIERMGMSLQLAFERLRKKA